jgi:hypothetical protein
VRVLGNGNYEEARVLRIDRQVDLALLKVTTIAKFETLTVHDDITAAGAGISDLCLAGYGLLKTPVGAEAAENEFKSVPAHNNGTKYGYLLASQVVEPGYSGGPAMVNNALVGIIVRQYYANGTLIIPAAYIIDFLAPEGIVLNTQTGSFEQGVSLSSLQTRLTNDSNNILKLRKSLNKIMHSMPWESVVSTKPYELILRAKRIFPDQPADGRLNVAICPIFDLPEEKVLPDEKLPCDRVESTIHDGRAVINMTEPMSLIKMKYSEMDIDISNLKLRRVEVIGEIVYSDSNSSNDSDSGLSDVVKVTAEIGANE